MLDIIKLLFQWLPEGLQGVAFAICVVGILFFFVEIILKIISIIRG